MTTPTAEFLDQGYELFKILKFSSKPIQKLQLSSHFEG